MTTHKEWVREATGDSIRAVARKLGRNEGNFNTQVNAGLPIETILDIAEAYELSKMQALIDTGILPSSESPAETIDQLKKRIDRDVSRLAELAEEKSNNVVTLRPRAKYDQSQGMPADAAADSSPDTEGDLDDLDP